MNPAFDPVLILHHAIPEPGTGPSAESDAGVMDQVNSVAAALRDLGVAVRVASVESLGALPAILASAPELIIVNLVENFPGRPADAMQVPTVCEAFGRQCTGNGSASQILALDKWRTKVILQAAGLPVPEGMIVPLPAGATRRPSQDPTGLHLPPSPWIVKPLFADASEGIYPSSVVKNDPRALRRAVARVHREFGHPALVETFFGTREINAALLQKGERIIALPLSEIVFRDFGANRPRIVDYAAKWHPDSFEYRNTVRVVPAPIPPSLAKRLRDAARAAWETMGCRDYARVDFRLDGDGRFAILEVNPNPDIAPDSGFEAALKAAAIPYRDFVATICSNAARRLAAAPGSPSTRRRSEKRKATRQATGRPRSTIRYSEASDRDAILRFMRGTGFFHEGEIEIAREVLDEALAKGPDGHYQSFTLLEGATPCGWICFGPTPCTIGTFDVYWIGVGAGCQGRGYGRALLEHAERLIRQRAGRQIIIETSGRPQYETTRGFYLKTGYREAARIPDFYGPGDARVIYAKPLDQP